MILPRKLDLADMQAAFTELNRRLERFEARNVDVNGRRWINAGDARDGGDYVTLRQVRKLIPTVEGETTTVAAATDELEVYVNGTLIPR